MMEIKALVFCFFFFLQFKQVKELRKSGMSCQTGAADSFLKIFCHQSFSVLKTVFLSSLLDKTVTPPLIPDLHLSFCTKYSICSSHEDGFTV